MRKKAKKLMVLPLLALLMLLINMVGNNAMVNAQGNKVIITEREVYLLVPGETRTIKVPIKAVGDTVYTPIVMAEAGTSPLTLSQPKLVLDGFDSPPNVLTPYSKQYIELDITADEIGRAHV